MDFDNAHLCLCKRAGILNHPPDHIICCKCIKCFNCERWIRKDRWQQHTAKPCEKPTEVTPPVLSPGAKLPAEEIYQDSLQVALDELGLDVASEEFGPDFCKEVRVCVGELIEHLNLRGGPITYTRTAAWQHVIGILLKADIDEDQKIEALKNLFDSAQLCDELELQITEVVFSTAVLFPSGVIT